MRIIVTGSRDFQDYMTVARALSVAIDELTHKFPEDKAITVVQGNARGADQLAQEFVNKTEPLLRGRGIRIRYLSYHAEWNKYGKSAGPKRNQKMVDDGADMVLAFLQKDALNKGTKVCMAMAVKAGLDVRSYWNQR